MARSRCGRIVVALLMLLGLAGSGLAQEDPPGTYAGRDATWWIGQLSDPNGYRAAMVAFRKIGRPALNPLVDALSSEDRKIRRGALAGLKEVRVSKAPVVDLLVEALDPRDLDFSGRVLDLIESTGRAALPHLDTVAPYVSCGHREASTRALGILIRLTPESRKELPRVLTLIENTDPRRRRHVVEAAVRIAPDSGEVVAALAKEIGRANDQDRRRLLSATRRLRPDAPGFADLVCGLAADPSPRVREEVARRLGSIALADPDRVPVLAGLLVDRDGDVRMAAARSAASMGSAAAPAVGALISMLGNEDFEDDLPAVAALAAIGPPAAPAFPAVVAMLERKVPSEHMKGAVINFIAGDQDMVVRALRSEKEGPRGIALHLLSGWSTEGWAAQLPAVLEPLGAVLLATVKGDHTERRILDGLSPLAATHPEVLRFYLRLAKARSPFIRDQAAAQLAGKRENLPLLAELLSSSDRDEVMFALRSLGSRPYATVIEGAAAPLAALLDSDDAAIRTAAAEVLLGAGIHDLPAERRPAAARAAVELLDHPKLRESAVGWLGALGEAALPHVDALLRLLADEDPHQFNKRAAWALRDIARSSDAARKAVLPRVVEVFEGDDAVAAAAAAHALGMFPECAETLCARLPALMRDPRKTVHFNAVGAVEAMGNRAEPLVPVLLEIAHSPPEGSHVDGWAVNALRRLAPDDERFLSLVLERFLDEKRAGERPLYQQALLAGGEAAAMAVAAALGEADTEGKLRLLGVLRQLGGRARDAVPRVKPLTKHEDPRVAKAAKELIASIPGAGDR
ncbi:MAG: HEAT repeat domain-containing protein [Planctomycetota bacterium]